MNLNQAKIEVNMIKDKIAATEWCHKLPLIESKGYWLFVRNSGWLKPGEAYLDLYGNLRKHPGPEYRPFRPSPRLEDISAIYKWVPNGE